MDGITLSGGSIGALSVRSLLKCNELSSRFGLTLSPTQAERLRNAEAQTLEETGRINLRDGILPALAEAFCSSPFISQPDWEATLCELQSLFYSFKNESDDSIPDDRLIELLRAAFDDRARGSLEYLSGLTPDELLRPAPEPVPDGFCADEGDAL